MSKTLGLMYNNFGNFFILSDCLRFASMGFKQMNEPDAIRSNQSVVHVDKTLTAFE